MIVRIVFLIFLGFLCNPLPCTGQDSIAVEDLDEQKELKFQRYFFKALSEKAIKNHQKAIENLNICNQIIPGDVSVLFEFSKNYLFLNEIENAKLYIEEALNKAPKNIWMLSHLVRIYQKEQNYLPAIKIQKKIIQLNPNKKSTLVHLYYLNRDDKEAMSLIDLIDKEKGLSGKLQSLKKSLESRKTPFVKKEEDDLNNLIASFEGGDISFTTLKKLLESALNEDIAVFHQYSKKGMDLFPAQPYMYLMRGKSLYLQKNNKYAVDVLETGIDFVIDRPDLELEFYIILAKAYDGLKKTNKAQKYRNKAKRLKEQNP